MYRFLALSFCCRVAYGRPEPPFTRDVRTLIQLDFLLILFLYRAANVELLKSLLVTSHVFVCVRGQELHVLLGSYQHVCLVDSHHARPRHLLLQPSARDSDPASPLLFWFYRRSHPLQSLLQFFVCTAHYAGTSVQADSVAMCSLCIPGCSRASSNPMPLCTSYVPRTLSLGRVSGLTPEFLHSSGS